MVSGMVVLTAGGWVSGAGVDSGIKPMASMANEMAMQRIQVPAIAPMMINRFERFLSGGWFIIAFV